jgi:hypothetical protein
MSILHLSKNCPTDFGNVLTVWYFCFVYLIINRNVAIMAWLRVTEYLCHKWPRICSVCRDHHPTISRFTTCHLVCSKSCVRVYAMAFNATFINISVISWRLVLLMDPEETGVPGKNHRPVACTKSNTTGGTGTAYPSGAPEFKWVRIARSLFFCVVFCRSLFVLFLFGHCIVCSSIYDFWLSLWYLQTFLIKVSFLIVT